VVLVLPLLAYNYEQLSGIRQSASSYACACLADGLVPWGLKLKLKVVAKRDVTELDKEKSTRMKRRRLNRTMKTRLEKKGFNIA
jgi:hypothetical protein